MMPEPASCEECGEKAILQANTEGMLECPLCGLCVQWKEEQTAPTSNEVLISDGTKYGTRDMFQKEMKNTGEYWPFEIGQGISPYRRAMLRQEEEKRMTSTEIAKNQYQKTPTLMDNIRVFTTEPAVQYAMMNYFDVKTSDEAVQPLQRLSVTSVHYLLLALARTSVHGMFIPPWVRTAAEGGVPSKLHHWRTFIEHDMGPSKFPASWNRLIDDAHQRTNSTSLHDQTWSLVLALMDSGLATRARLSSAEQKDLRSTLSQRASQALDALEIEAKETGFESGVDLIEQTFPQNQDTAPNWFPCFHLNAALVAHLVLSLILDLHPMTPQDQEAMRTLMDAILPSEGMWDGGAQEGLYSTTTGRSCLSTWQEFERSIKLNVNIAW